MIKKYRRPNDLKRTYGDFYPYIETDLTLQEYRSLMKDIFRAIMRDLIIHKRFWHWPFGLGTIGVYSRKQPADKQPIDRKASRIHKKEVRFKNLHTAKYIYVILYKILRSPRYYHPSNLGGLNVYNFGPAREHKRFLFKLIKSSSEDPYTKTYSVPHETPIDLYPYLRR